MDSLSRKAVLWPSQLGLEAGSSVSGLMQGGSSLQRCGLPCADFLQKNEGKGCLFAVFHNYSQTLERLHIKNIRKSELWGINGFLEITEILYFWFFGFWGFSCQGEKSFWQTEIFLYGTSPVLVASNPRTTESNWKMLLQFCQASDWALYPELGMSIHHINNWVWYWQHMQKGSHPFVGPKTLCYTIVRKG